VKKLTNGTVFHQQKLYNYYKNPVELNKDERISGAYAWLALFAGVVAYDIFAIKTKKAETLTRAFWRSTERPVKNIIPIGLWLTLSFHLLAEKTVRKKIFGGK
jgi:hypothetical protein